MGIKPATLVLNCAMHKLVREEAALSPKKSAFMLELGWHAYVDDIPMAGDTHEETLRKARTAKQVAARGCFDLFKNSFYLRYLSELLG